MIFDRTSVPYTEIYLYSPLSTTTVQEGEGPALLLQFFLSELLLCAKSDTRLVALESILSTPARFFPFDWSYEVGYLNKLEEHSRLIPHAFSQMDQQIDALQATVEATVIEIGNRKRRQSSIAHEKLIEILSGLYEDILPFVIACKESENLVLFLLKHADDIAPLAKSQGVGYLIGQMLPGRSYDGIRNQYDRRGFQAERRAFDKLIAPYERH